MIIGFAGVWFDRSAESIPGARCFPKIQKKPQISSHKKAYKKAQKDQANRVLPVEGKASPVE